MIHGPQYRRILRTDITHKREQIDQVENSVIGKYQITQEIMDTLKQQWHTPLCTIIGATDGGLKLIRWLPVVMLYFYQTMKKLWLRDTRANTNQMQWPQVLEKNYWVSWDWSIG